MRNKFDIGGIVVRYQSVCPSSFPQVPRGGGSPPNPTSPIWWMGTLYGVYMVLIATEPLTAMDTTVAMGSSIGMGIGLARSGGAPGPVVASTCPSGAGAVTTAPGSITVTGAAMSAGQASCTITVAVTSATPGVYTNTDAGNITLAQRVTTTGVNATLTVQARPTLSKAIAPAVVGVGQYAVLTFTITNPAGAPARSGLAFTDTLPANLVIGTPNGVASTCGGSPTITAAPGTGVFTVGGTGVNAAAGASTCTIQVNVASASPGTYTNGAGSITAISGLVYGVTDQSLAVTQATLTKAFGSAARDDSEANTLILTLTNACAGNAAQGGIAFTETLPSGLRCAAEKATTDAVGGTTDSVRAARELLRVPPEITRDLTHWSTDPELYLTWRRRAYQLLGGLRASIGGAKLDEYVQEWECQRKAFIDGSFERRVSASVSRGKGP